MVISRISGPVMPGAAAAGKSSTVMAIWRCGGEGGAFCGKTIAGKTRATAKAGSNVNNFRMAHSNLIRRTAGVDDILVYDGGMRLSRRNWRGAQDIARE